MLHQIRCEAYSRAGRYDEAFEEAQKIIELRPDADEYTAQKELEDMKRHRTELEGETELVRMRAKCKRLQEEIEMLKSMTKWLEENR